MAIVTLGLSACASGATPLDATPEETEVAAPTLDPQPSASGVAIAWPVVRDRPDTQIPFTCEDLLPRTLFTGETTSEAVLVTERDWNTPFFEAARMQQGSLVCVWEDDHYAGTRIQLSIRRNAAQFGPMVEYSSTAAIERNTLGGEKSYLDCGVHDGPISCTFGSEDGDYQLEGYFTSDFAAPVVAAGQELAHRFAESATTVMSSAVEPPLWTAPAGSWPLQVDCDAVEEGGSVSSALGADGDFHIANAWEEEVTPASSIGGSSECWWFYDGSGSNIAARQIELTTLAGGAWFWEEPDPVSTNTITAVSVPGTDDARVRCTKNDCWLEARIGSNAFALRGAASDADGTRLTAAQLATIAPSIAEGLRSWMNGELG